MTIAEVREKCKSIIAGLPRDILIVGVIILSALLSFGFGYLAGRETGQGRDITLEEHTYPATIDTDGVGTTEQEVRQVIASKNGTKYYFPECSGTSRIAEKNKVYFVSASAALAKGYTLAANCKGP